MAERHLSPVRASTMQLPNTSASTDPSPDGVGERGEIVNQRLDRHRILHPCSKPRPSGVMTSS